MYAGVRRGGGQNTVDTPAMNGKFCSDHFTCTLNVLDSRRNVLPPVLKFRVVSNE